MNSGNTLADIALSLPERPNSAEILGALQKAYEAGFAAGVVSGQNYMAKITEMVTDSVGRP